MFFDLLEDLFSKRDHFYGRDVGHHYTQYFVDGFHPGIGIGTTAPGRRVRVREPITFKATGGSRPSKDTTDGFTTGTTRDTTEEGVLGAPLAWNRDLNPTPRGGPFLDNHKSYRQTVRPRPLGQYPRDTPPRIELHQRRPDSGEPNRTSSGSLCPR